MKKVGSVLLVLMVSVGLLVTGGAAQAIEAPYDFGGETVRIVAAESPEYADFVDLPYVFLPVSHGEAPAYIEHIEEAFNVNIEWEGIDWWEAGYGMMDWFATDVMAGEGPDLLFAFIYGHLPAKAEGLLKPLDENVIKNDVPDIKARLVDSYSKFAGEHYTFANTWPRPGAGLAWNKDLFEREGLPSLYELREEGEWTWENYREIALQATRDTTGDGEIDQWGTTVWWDNYWDTFPVDFMASNEAEIFTFENGRPVYTLDRPEGIEAFEFMHTLFHEDESVVPVGEGSTDLFFYQGQVAMHHGNTDQFRHMEPVGESPDELGAVPLPMGPNATEHRAPFIHQVCWSIPVGTEYPQEALVELVFALATYTEEYMSVEPFFDTDMETRIQEDLDDFSTYVFDRETVEQYRWENENVEVFTQQQEIFFPDFAGLIDEILFEGRSPSTVIAEYKPEVQARLDEVFGY